MKAHAVHFSLLNVKVKLSGPNIIFEILNPYSAPKYLKELFWTNLKFDDSFFQGTSEFQNNKKKSVS